MPPAAVVRAVPASIGDCELTHREREPIDLARARAQHAAYVDALRDAGLRILELPEADDLPDSVFVEDLLIDAGPVRVLANPGAASRRAERESLRRACREALREYGPFVEMPEHLRLDGGDVIRLPEWLLVGVTSRTDKQAAAWLGEVAGLPVRTIAVKGALHLKSVVSPLSDRVLLVHPGGVEMSKLADFDLVRVGDGEAASANALRLPGLLPTDGCGDWDRGSALRPVVLMRSGSPQTAARIARWGFVARFVDNSELEKAEAGLTCSSVLLGL